MLTIIFSEINYRIPAEADSRFERISEFIETHTVSRPGGNDPSHNGDKVVTISSGMDFSWKRLLDLVALSQLRDVYYIITSRVERNLIQDEITRNRAYKRIIDFYQIDSRSRINIVIGSRFTGSVHAALSKKIEEDESFWIRK